MPRFVYLAAVALFLPAPVSVAQIWDCDNRTCVYDLPKCPDGYCPDRICERQGMCNQCPPAEQDPGNEMCANCYTDNDLFCQCPGGGSVENKNCFATACDCGFARLIVRPAKSDWFTRLWRDGQGCVVPSGIKEFHNVKASKPKAKRNRASFSRKGDDAASSRQSI
ncbi:MAG TPA: hypothetical protein VFA60_11705 [Terriglobales bacterium]|nr:hypothetical protein [Terriglobales bacterium]